MTYNDSFSGVTYRCNSWWLDPETSPWWLYPETFPRDSGYKLQLYNEVANNKVVWEYQKTFNLREDLFYCLEHDVKLSTFNQSSTSVTLEWGTERLDEELGLIKYHIISAEN